MKKTLIMILALALTALCAAALAEDLPWEGGILITDQVQDVDLDGDGSVESVGYAMVPDDFEPYMQLQVTGADGATVTWDTGVISSEKAWAGDLDGDGVMEIFVWGDVMSDDYYTACVSYKGGRLVPKLFADVNRGENGHGYFKEGYGLLDNVDFDAHTVTLTGSQDMLGTYFMSRTLKLDDALFEAVDGGVWVRAVNDASWDGYSVLTAKAAIRYLDPDGVEGTLQPGDKIQITGTDKMSMATFLAEDGRIGTLRISEDYERGWGSLVDDIPEDDAFEFIPYAD
ncbi:MAG: hypothetical protein IJJ45_02180 [Clostridia bacterium]|nr:hypothetical protein [Clostridia bacterium]